MGFIYTDGEVHLNVYVNQAGGIRLRLSEERAVDGGNEMFECSAFLDPVHAKRLRDFLVTSYPYVDNDKHSLDLYWHALNYRGASSENARACWEELSACVERLKMPERD